MTEHPIIFTTPMVPAILDGRKTQTRRVIRPRCKNVWGYYPAHRFWVGPHPNGGFWAIDNPEGPPESIVRDQKARGVGFVAPYQPGDLLWVREAWGECIFPGGGAFFARRKIAYKADGEPKFNIERWRSPYHLFKKDARLWLEVVSVRVERVQEISEEDAIAEGMVAEGWTTPPAGSIGLPDKIKTARYPIGQFAGLWDSLNAKRGYGWDQNPWVWRIAFKKINHDKECPHSSGELTVGSFSPQGIPFKTG